ncbi:MAG: AAA family ATPase [Bacteroidetes bacterium]|nr:AAA family ATPase [Bacteroidota bacterium]
MRIDRLGLKNFRCFDEFEIVFNPEFNMHVLVAENMAGKSAIFQAIRIGLSSFVAAINGLDLSIEREDHRIVGINPIADIAQICELAMEATTRSIENQEIALVWKRWHSTSGNSAGNENLESLDRLAAEMYKSVTEHNVGRLPMIAYFGTEYVHVALTDTSSFGEDFQALLGYDGCLSGKSIEPFLLNWFERMASRAQESQTSEIAKSMFGQIPQAALGVFRNVLGLLLPSLHSFEWITASSTKKGNARVLAFRFEDGTIRLFDQLSDGYQYLCLMAAELSMRAVLLNKHLGPTANLEVPGVVLIDEFGIHLHPELQAATLKRLSEAFPKVQFIVSTHSPMLLKDLDAEQVYILEADEQGKRSIRHPKEDLFWVGAEGILRDVFGTQSTFGEVAIAAVKEHATLSRKAASSELNPEEEQRFAFLTQKLGALSYDDSLTDPLYQRFLDMVAERQTFRSLVAESSPSDDEMKEMVDRLLAEMNNSSSSILP